MKVVFYVCHEGGKLHFLYVNGDLDKSKLPSKITKLMQHEKGHDCRETAISDFGPNAVCLFNKNGYLFAPDIVWEESEGSL